MSTESKKEKKDSSASSSGAAVTLQDVLDSNPKEDKTVTRMIRSIEEQEGDEEKGMSPADDILTGVPEQHGSHRAFQSHSSVKKNSVEESLFHLTQKMGHGLGSFAAPEKSGAGGNDGSADFHNSQADMFASNAGKLMDKARLVERTVEGDTTTAYESFKSFLAFRRDSLRQYTKFAVLYLIVPFVGLTCFLFYAVDNPGGESADPETGVIPDQASSSWWINFVFVRNVITLSLAKGTEAIIVDFCCLGSSVCLKLLGPFATLLLAQSKGWPFQLLLWGVYNFAMLYGDSKFARHWLFYQEAIDVFNDKNQAGTVTQADSWEDFLICFVLVGGVVCLKRFFVSLWYGQAIFRHYGKDLANIMNKAVLIGNVATFAKNTNAMSGAKNLDLDFEKMQESEENTENDEEDEDSPLLFHAASDSVYGLTERQKMKIQDLLGEWEEPSIDDRKIEEAPVSAIVQFRAAVTTIDNDFPFSRNFGRADKRETCFDSAQKLYLHMINGSNKTGSDDASDVLKFDTIAMVALKDDGTLDETILKDLISIFRPTRGGDISILDFVKSIDAVYKDLRVIRAAIYNARKMNAASQRILNVVFYFILFWVVLAILGIDPVALFAGLVGFIVGFAFMIGGASSKYFEGLLLVLVRKPYDIGDRIAVSPAVGDTSPSGSSGWIVKDLDLFKTTVIFGATNEEATYSNGSLASSRIINHHRSPKAIMAFTVKFHIDISQTKIKTFGEAVAQFVKDRPREWLVFVAYRLANVVPEQGYVEYAIIMMHREGWQQIGALMTSKAEVTLFAYELSKEMGMGYENPAMPVILSTRSGGNRDEGENEGDGIERAKAMVH